MLMTPAEEGAYIRLLSICWMNGHLPDDDNQLAELSRLGEGWFNGGSEKLRKCFTVRHGKLYNERLSKERGKQLKWRQKSREGGKKSAKFRKQKRLQQNPTNKGGSQMVANSDQPNGNQRPTLQSSSSSSSSSKKNNKEKVIFEQARSAFPGRKRGLDTEFNYFQKRKDWRKALPLLLPAIERQKKHRKELAAAGMWAPEWKDFKSWIYNRYWEIEPSKPETEKDSKLCVVDRKPGVKFQTNGRGKRVYLCTECLKVWGSKGGWGHLPLAEIEKRVLEGKANVRKQEKERQDAADRAESELKFAETVKKMSDTELTEFWQKFCQRSKNLRLKLERLRPDRKELFDNLKAGRL